MSFNPINPNGQAVMASSQPVVIASNQSAVPMNFAQLVGTATDVNSGLKSAGTIRVVIATDQPALTNKLLVTPDSVALPANQSVNISQINGVTPLMGNGVTGTGSPRVTLVSDGTAISTAGFLSVKFDQTTVGTTNGVSLAQLGATTIATGNGVVGTGVQRVAIASDNTAFSVNATPVPAASGGPTKARVMSAASTNATSTKASAGQLYGWYFYNNTASAKFVKFYNKASSPTVGTDTPTETIAIPANGGTNVEFSMGIPYATGIAYAITGAITDADTTAVAANDVTGFFLYK